MNQTAILTSPPKIILDSNIWVDIVIFNDPRTHALQAALRAGRLQSLSNTACRDELVRVLDYPQFKRYAFDQQAAMAQFDALTTLVEVDEASRSQALKLPTCKDLDDQKFIELARDTQAQFLLSKDKLVLKMASRIQRLIGCEIMPPEKFNLLLNAHV